ncbi:MAG: peptidylprolyl isomerase [Cyanobacteria bacterium P01_E01_bin.6]
MLCSVGMVNFSGIDIDTETIVNFLKQEIRLKDLCQEIVFRDIIQQAVQEYELSVDDDEIQEEANRQRYENRLESSSDTYAWLEEELIKAEDWEIGIQKRLQSKKLADFLFKDSIRSYFSQHQVEYERVILYHITVPYELLAQELFYQIEEEEMSFYEAAHLYDVDEKRRLFCGYEGLVHRWDLEPDVSAQVFGANPKEVIGPIQSREGFNLYMVEEFMAAELTEEIAEEINQKLFDEWLLRELNYRIHESDSLSDTLEL